MIWLALLVQAALLLYTLSALRRRARRAEEPASLAAHLSERLDAAVAALDERIERAERVLAALDEARSVSAPRGRRPARDPAERAFRAALDGRGEARRPARRA